MSHSDNSYDLEDIINTLFKNKRFLEELEKHCIKSDCDLNVVMNYGRSHLTKEKETFSEKRFHTISKNHIRKNGYFRETEIPNSVYCAIANVAINRSETLKVKYVLDEL